VTQDQRRLAAIVSVDAVGYSRLMGRDESGTVAGSKAHRRELIDPKIAEHNGRIVKTTGDGLLLEMLFAHLKRILKLDRLRLRGPNGAHDEFLLAATAQNLRRMAKWLVPIAESGEIAPA
jgi:class 3 adenylate cyclase